MAFAGIKAGDKVVDVLPGGGYFTRIFSQGRRGRKGHVYAVVPMDKRSWPPARKRRIGVKAIAADKEYGNVSVEIATARQRLKTPAPVDVVWTSDNYHDLKNKAFGPADTAAMNKAIFASLKPGGVYIVIDHSANAGQADATETLHRIDPAVVKAEVTAAGFKFDGESRVLHRTSDDHTGKVFDAGMRGKTDQFIYKFRKPKN